MSLPRFDRAHLADSAFVGAAVADGDALRWRCHTTVEKYAGGIAAVRAGLLAPYERLEVPGNALLIGGADAIWAGLKHLLSTSSTKFQYFDNAHAALCVGNSTVAVASSQTDLQASSGAANRSIVGMDATFPTHTTGAIASTSSKILYKATFSTAVGNFAWKEWGVGNKVSAVKPYPGRLLNRKVAALGTKTSAGTWALTVTLSLA